MMTEETGFILVFFQEINFTLNFMHKIHPIYGHNVIRIFSIFFFFLLIPDWMKR